METKVSTKGQIVLPHQIRKRLGVRSGDPLDVSVESGRIVLTPMRPPKFQARVITDPLTGFPVIDCGPDAPVLTSEQVAEMLADFP
jgi:AbrB family looped-hinge helix DNA binding protein